MRNTEFDIARLVTDYRMMKAEIKRLQSIIYGFSIPMTNWGVAQYGLDAAMPKGSSGKSVAEMKQMDIREKKQRERLERMECIVFALESVFDILDDETAKTIYDCLLDGMTHRDIAAHLTTSKDFVRIKKQEIFRQISQNSQILTYLQKEKIAV
ncbi:sigma-70 family RNA polymerase sigma factor [Psychrobacillus vulpis]|uniref:Sigma-70 family RNA polymerase sigma factor n=1 Tax=Psychrobacillus vulpis TaxID=2325572 RepID=A0A544TWJ6_9BACI|nr:sigma-70 family RNA polymerase sigma factor [Psychrobacillus vulpis]TQR21810.1 sigma-70 family RNA polymerase sigma factor [Psychrobacillus vulpis]